MIAVWFHCNLTALSNKPPLHHNAKFIHHFRCMTYFDCGVLPIFKGLHRFDHQSFPIFFSWPYKKKSKKWRQLVWGINRQRKLVKWKRICSNMHNLEEKYGWSWWWNKSTDVYQALPEVISLLIELITPKGKWTK